MEYQYIAFTNDQEYGPVGFEELNTLWQTSRLSDETPVRRVSQNYWSNWKLLREERLLELQVAARKEQEAASVRANPGAAIIAKRAELRRNSAYPGLRSFMVALLVIGLLVLAISIYQLFFDDTRTFGIVGVLGAVGSIFSTLILGVLLDIADSTIGKSS